MDKQDDTVLTRRVEPDLGRGGTQLLVGNASVEESQEDARLVAERRRALSPGRSSSVAATVKAFASDFSWSAIASRVRHGTCKFSMSHVAAAIAASTPDAAAVIASGSDRRAECVSGDRASPGAAGHGGLGA